MHLLIYFCGTGGSGNNLFSDHQYLQVPNIKVLFVNGCYAPEVCDAIYFPDLKAFAKRFVNHLFQQIDGPAGKVWAINPDSPESIGIIPARLSSLSDLNCDGVESITLCGYSRGAVTCFEIAKQLYKIAPEIPVDIVADQPVPGNCYQGIGTNARRIADCSQLTNLKHVSIILAAYTGAVYEYGMVLGEEYETSTYHRLFFSQILPKLPNGTQRDIIVIPRESHHQYLRNSPDGHEHMHLQIARYLNNKKLISDDTITNHIRQIRQRYLGYSPKLFPQQRELQGFFGLNTKKAYRYLDPLHPTPGLRMGYTFVKNESISNWWARHDKNTSCFSSELTKKLVASIKNTTDSDIEALKILFTEADHWLLDRENKSSSRYYLVEALRNNLEHRLIHRQVPQAELNAIKLKNLQSTGSFLTRWKSISNISWFKTAQTRQLDQAFLAHSSAIPSRENDQNLLHAVDSWLKSKQESGSRRWEEVTEIQKQLSIALSYYEEAPPNASDLVTISL